MACSDMSPTDYRVSNESLLIGGEVCLWTEFADDDSIMPRLWSVSVHCAFAISCLLATLFPSGLSCEMLSFITICFHRLTECCIMR